VIGDEYFAIRYFEEE
jgi:hypothetical protein